MIKKISILILNMFGVGNSKYAPGTVASFITTLIFIYFYTIHVNILILVFCLIIIFIFSVYSIDKYQNFFDTIDAKEIVIDEFIGQSIPILTIYSFVGKNDMSNFMLWALVSFVLFRLFDITKPYPINKIDNNMKNGFGVMLDDILAGIYSAVVLLIIIVFINYV
ncbi:phosphatidylglycerophosphatase A [Pelagibacteraceae bacterium]|nr:phosphatidylglycerophosphatase A [Pelagibacteraceae bacterium]